MIYRLSNTVCLLKRMKLSHVHHEDLDNVFMSRSKKNTSVGTEFFFTSDSVAYISQIAFSSSPLSFLIAKSTLN